jgi:DMSO/TMAO reductase YedYZ molybdopterin-dependent catalytic subunit
MNTLLRFTVSALIIPALFAQQDSKITVGGDVAQPLTLTKEDLAKMPRTKVVQNGRGSETIYEGVLLYEVLKRAGAPLDQQLSGKALASYVLADASDGYQVVYTLTELDPAFADNKVLLADTIDGKPLPAEQGPFRLIAPQDKRAARSVRMLNRLTVVRLRK